MQWHDIRNPNDPLLDRLAKQYGLHPLHIEDCRHRNQSAKIEENGGYLFVVLKTVEAEDEGLNIGDLDFFLGGDWLITVMEHQCATAIHILDNVKSVSQSLRADQVFYRVMDGLVDSYVPLLDRFNETIDGLEDRVLERPDPATLENIFRAKRSLIELRRVLANMRDVSGHLQRTENDLIPRDLWPFLRDVYDHLARNLDMVEMQRDLLSGALDIYLSSVANRTNQVMKVLTVLGTVALPALVLSSFYGMNLKHLPWAEHPHAMGIVSGLMVLSTAVVLWVLKRFGWL